MTVNKILNISAVLIASLYALILAALPVSAFTDRDNYFTYASSALEILQKTSSDGFLTIFYNEPIWLFINMFISLFLSPENTVRVIILIFSFVFSLSLFYYLEKRKISHWLLVGILIILLPQVMKNYVIHLRQGVAMAIFFFAISRDVVKLKTTLLLITPLIHSSYFFVVPMYLIAKKMSLIKISSSLFLSIAQLFFLSFIFSLEYLSGMFSARQFVQYVGSNIEVSGFAFLYWALILLLFILGGRKFVKTNLPEITGILLYLNFYFFFEPSGRIFESYLPMVIASGFILQRLYGHIYRLSFLFIFAAQWIIPFIAGSEIFRSA